MAAARRAYAKALHLRPTLGTISQDCATPARAANWGQSTLSCTTGSSGLMQHRDKCRFRVTLLPLDHHRFLLLYRHRGPHSFITCAAFLSGAAWGDLAAGFYHEAQLRRASQQFGPQQAEALRGSAERLIRGAVGVCHITAA